MTPAERTKRHHVKMIKNGLCVRCRKPRDGKSQWRCKACLRRMADQQKARGRYRVY